MNTQHSSFYSWTVSFRPPVTCTHTKLCMCVVQTLATQTRLPFSSGQMRSCHDNLIGISVTAARWVGEVAPTHRPGVWILRGGCWWQCDSCHRAFFSSLPPAHTSTWLGHALTWLPPKHANVCTQTRTLKLWFRVNKCESAWILRERIKTLHQDQKKSRKNKLTSNYLFYSTSGSLTCLSAT